MKNQSLTLLTAVSLLLNGSVLLAKIKSGKQPADKLKKRIESIIVPKKYKRLKAGILVHSLSRDETLYERNADTLLIPASINKLLTAYVALKKLKPTYTFKTKVYTTGTVQDGVLGGDVYLVGQGDPILVSERMWMLVNDFSRTGIKEVSGNLYGDASYFDKVRTPKSRMQYLKDQAYNAPVGALSFNFNSAAVYVKPAEKSGDLVVAHTDPPDNTYIDIVNQARTVRKGKRSTLSVSRIAQSKKSRIKNITNQIGSTGVGDTVLLRGNMPKGTKEVRYYRNIVNPTLYTAHMFKLLLERRGISVRGNVLEGALPSTAKRRVVFESLPLWQIVWGMNKFSNNFTADQLLKTVGAEKWGVPGTLKKGLTTLVDSLEDIGIKRGTYNIEDGSGLTRKSKISPTQMMRVLKSAYHDFSVSPEFVSSLGIAGQDGTLRRRLTSRATSQLRAKTGSLNGVSSLAGYTPSKDGEMLAFVIMLNDPSGKYGYMSGWVDKIAREIAKFSRIK